jgi:hypothetical protein
MNESELQDLRRKRLIAWVEDRGGVLKSLSGRQYPSSYPSYISQIINGYSFGSRAARTCEQRLGMPPLWLDDITEKQTEQPVRKEITTEDAIKKLGEDLMIEIQKEAREDIADALSKMALRGGSERDQQMVIHLIKSATTLTKTKRAA